MSSGSCVRYPILLSEWRCLCMRLTPSNTQDVLRGRRKTLQDMPCTSLKRLVSVSTLCCLSPATRLSQLNSTVTLPSCRLASKFGIISFTSCRRTSCLCSESRVSKVVHVHSWAKGLEKPQNSGHPKNMQGPGSSLIH